MLDVHIHFLCISYFNNKNYAIVHDVLVLLIALYIKFCYLLEKCRKYSSEVMSLVHAQLTHEW